MKKEYWMIILAVLGGVIFADKIRAVPVIGSKIPTL